MSTITIITTVFKLVIVEREKAIEDIKELNARLLREGFKNIRYFRKAKSVIDAVKQVAFTPHLEEDKPALYFPPISAHDAPFVLQPNRILVQADTETKGNQLIDNFIFTHLRKRE